MIDRNFGHLLCLLSYIFLPVFESSAGPYDTRLPNHLGPSQVIPPLTTIVATIGHDVTLPCNLQPAVDASNLTVEWRTSKIRIFVWRRDEVYVHEKYAGVSLSTDKIKCGDASLRLFNVTVSHEETYMCHISTKGMIANIQLVVGAVSSLVTVGFERTTTGVALYCRSEGWYPKPDVSWLDSEGNHPARSTETRRHPDGLYTVISKLTVEKSNSNRFTCRIQQQKINQTRETQLCIPDDLIVIPTGGLPCYGQILISVVVTVIIVIVLLLYYKCMQC